MESGTFEASATRFDFQSTTDFGIKKKIFATAIKWLETGKISNFNSSWNPAHTMLTEKKWKGRAWLSIECLRVCVKAMS